MNAPTPRIGWHPAAKLILRGSIGLVIGVVLTGALFAARVMDPKVQLSALALLGISSLILTVGVVWRLLAALFSGEFKVVAMLVGALLVLAGLGAGGYFGVTYYLDYQKGEAVPGDELVQLIGKNRNDADVQAVFKRLGEHSNSYSGDDMKWYSHGVAVSFDRSGLITALKFEKYGSKLSPLPYGLTLNDTLDQIKTKLGADNADKDGRTFTRENRKISVDMDYDGKLREVRVR